MDSRPINLAAARVKERQICKAIVIARLNTIGLLLVASLALAAAGQFWCASSRRQQQICAKKIAEVQADIQKMEAGIGEVRSHQADARWNRKLARRNMQWLDAINSLSIALPGQAWLSRLETIPQSGTIKLDGATADMQSLSQIATRLSSTGDFADLKLGSTESMSLDDRAAVRFTLTCRVPSIQAASDQSASTQPAASQAPPAEAEKS